MWLKEMLKQAFSDEEKIIQERYTASKFSLILSATLFFINFYFVWAKFYLEYFIESLIFVYIYLLLSFVFYFYFLVRKLLYWKAKEYVFAILAFVLILFFVTFMSPVFAEWWVSVFLDFLRLFFN